MALDKTAEYLTEFFHSHQHDYELMMRDAGSTRYPHPYEEQGEVIQAIRDIVHNISDNYWNLSVPDGYPSPKILRDALVGLRDLAAAHLERVHEINAIHGSNWVTEVQHAAKICGEVKEAINHALTLSTTPTDSPLERLKRVLVRLPQVARQLEMRRKDGQIARPTLKITDEYDVQDLLHSVLKIDFDDIRPEEWAPSYAGTSKRSDFLLKREMIVIEVKKTRPALGQKDIVDQLVIDIANYGKHPDCKHLVCVIWDTDYLLKNPAALISDLEDSNVGFVSVLVLN